LTEFFLDFRYVNPFKNKQGKLLTDSDEVKNRWLEHFRALYNPYSTPDQSVLLEIPTTQIRDTPTPHLLISEVEAAITSMKRNKSPGVDNITAEEIQASGQHGVDILFNLCCKIWDMEEVPDCWKRSVIVPVFKKQDKLCCDNYRGISLLPHCEKLLASIILQRIRQRTDEILSEAQAGLSYFCYGTRKCS